jgi:hypothetical protein
MTCPMPLRVVIVSCCTLVHAWVGYLRGIAQFWKSKDQEFTTASGLPYPDHTQVAPVFWPAISFLVGLRQGVAIYNTYVDPENGFPNSQKPARLRALA